MRIIIPETFGDELEVLPEGEYQAHIESVMLGRSRTSGQPKVTIRWVVDDGEYAGKPLLDTYSLQPQALWRLNRLFRRFSGNRLEHGTYTPEEFESILTDALVGQSANIIVITELTPDGNEINRVEKVL